MISYVLKISQPKNHFHAFLDPSEKILVDKMESISFFFAYFNIGENPRNWDWVFNFKSTLKWELVFVIVF